MNSSPTNMAQRKTRDSDYCSVNFLKGALHFFNVVFFLSGLAVLGVGVWTLVDKQRYVSLLTTVTYSLAAYVLIVAGSLVIIVTVIGCIGVSKEDRCFLLIYTFLLLLIFLMEAMVGILSYVYAEQVEKELDLNLNTTFLQSYNIDPDRTIAIDHLQEEFRCCGAKSYSDWRYSKWHQMNPNELNLVPDSCCITVSQGCGKRDGPSNIHYKDCMEQLAKAIQEHLIILGAVGLGICVLQIFGMIFSCSLYIKLKDIID